VERRGISKGEVGVGTGGRGKKVSGDLFIREGKKDQD